MDVHLELGYAGTCRNIIFASQVANAEDSYGLKFEGPFNKRRLDLKPARFDTFPQQVRAPACPIGRPGPVCFRRVCFECYLYIPPVPLEMIQRAC